MENQRRDRRKGHDNRYNDDGCVEGCSPEGPSNRSTQGPLIDVGRSQWFEIHGGDAVQNGSTFGTTIEMFLELVAIRGVEPFVDVILEEFLCFFVVHTLISV